MWWIQGREEKKQNTREKPGTEEENSEGVYKLYAPHDSGFLSVEE